MIDSIEWSSKVALHPTGVALWNICGFRISELQNNCRF